MRELHISSVFLGPHGDHFLGNFWVDIRRHGDDRPKQTTVVLWMNSERMRPKDRSLLSEVKISHFFKFQRACFDISDAWECCCYRTCEKNVIPGGRAERFLFVFKLGKACPRITCPFTLRNIQIYVSGYLARTPWPPTVSLL